MLVQPIMGSMMGKEGSSSSWLSSSEEGEVGVGEEEQATWRMGHASMIVLMVL